MPKKRTTAQLAADKKRTGRPPKDRDEKHSEAVMVYLTQDERKRFESLAKQDGESMASLIMRPWRDGE